MYLAELFVDGETFQPNVVEKIKTRFMLNNFLCRKSRRLRGNVKK
jgi:hypothetical protein